MPRRHAAPDGRQLALFEAPLGVPRAAPWALAAPPTLLPPSSRSVVPSPPEAGPRHPHADREIRLNDHLVAYALRRGARRSIGFIVGIEGLSVSAPKWVGLRDVEAALRAKADWILRKLAEQHQRRRRLDAARVEWRDGVTIPFLGVPLSVVLDPQALSIPGGRAGSSAAALRAAPADALRDALLGAPPDASDATPDASLRTLPLDLPRGASPAQIRDAVRLWLQHQARRVFEARCQHFAPQLGVRYKRLALSSAQTRWGSASADGSIRLNWRLVHFALPTIDYVVAHELAHLREMNHSPCFWEVVRSVLPDYEQARSALRDGVVPLFD